MRVVIDSSVVVAALATPNPESASRVVLAAVAAGAVPADPGDDKVVAAALAGRAAFVVTLDRHLLEVGGLTGVSVLRPGDFLRELRATH